LFGRHSTFERTSRDSARPVVTFARTRSVRRLPIVTVGSVRVLDALRLRAGRAERDDTLVELFFR
jgi:hypothetical protein